MRVVLWLNLPTFFSVTYFGFAEGNPRRERSNSRKFKSSTREKKSPQGLLARVSRDEDQSV